MSGRPVDRSVGRRRPTDAGPGPRRAARPRWPVRRGGSAAIRSRSHRARAGLAPPVETATVTGPSRWTAGSCTVPGVSPSALLTSTPAAAASATTCASTAGVAGGRDHQVRSRRPHPAGRGGARAPRCRASVPGPASGRATAADLAPDVAWPRSTSGATTVTRAPGRRRPRARRVATGPPPTTRQRRPATVEDHRVVGGVAAGVLRGSGRSWVGPWCAIRASGRAAGAGQRVDGPVRGTQPSLGPRRPDCLPHRPGLL